MWKQSFEEEEILKVIPGMGAQAKAVEPLAFAKMFVSAIQFATSSPPSSMNDLKASAQQQVEYMLSEDEATPLLNVVDEIKMEAKQCADRLLTRFVNLVDSPIGEAAGEMEVYLMDLSWTSGIVTKLESSSDFVVGWVDTSVNIVKVAEEASPAIQVKVLEVSVKILEAIGYGSVILGSTKRVEMVKVWLPFVRLVKTSVNDDEEDNNDLWQSLESALVSMILTLPSSEQAQILTEWLRNRRIQYPDLTQAFELWCYRSKVARRRLPLPICNRDK